MTYVERLEGLIQTTITAAREQAEESSLHARHAGNDPARAFYRGHNQGTADTFRRVARELEHGLAALTTGTEDHEYDHTPADFVEGYRLADQPLEEAA